MHARGSRARPAREHRPGVSPLRAYTLEGTEIARYGYVVSRVYARRRSLASR